MPVTERPQRHGNERARAPASRGHAMIDHHPTKFLGLTFPQSNIAGNEDAVSNERPHLVIALDREMLGLSMLERRRRWKDDDRRLDLIMNVAVKHPAQHRTETHVQERV